MSLKMLWKMGNKYVKLQGHSKITCLTTRKPEKKNKFLLLEKG